MATHPVFLLFVFFLAFIITRSLRLGLRPRHNFFRRFSVGDSIKQGTETNFHQSEVHNAGEFKIKAPALAPYYLFSHTQ